jgi:hypothetical protein
MRQRDAGEDGKDVYVMGVPTSSVKHSSGHFDKPAIIIAPVILGTGKRLFEGFPRSLEQLGVRQSQFATFIDYRVTQT